MTIKLVSNWIKMFPMTPEPKQYVWVRFKDGEIRLVYSFHVNQYGVILLDPLKPFQKIIVSQNNTLITHWRPVEEPNFKEEWLDTDTI